MINKRKNRTISSKVIQRHYLVSGEFYFRFVNSKLCVPLNLHYLDIYNIYIILRKDRPRSMSDERRDPEDVFETVALLTNGDTSTGSSQPEQANNNHDSVV